MQFFIKVSSTLLWYSIDVTPSTHKSVPLPFGTNGPSPHCHNICNSLPTAGNEQFGYNVRKTRDNVSYVYLCKIKYSHVMCVCVCLFQVTRF
jgi:hypothetical protein